MPKIVQIGMGGSDVAAPPTELTDNLDPALLFESSDGADYLKISTSDGAEGVTVEIPGPGSQDSNTGFTVHAPTGNLFRAARQGASGSGNVIFMDSGTNSIKVLGTGTQFNTTNNITTHLGTSNDFWLITDDGDADILRITQTGFFTHTLSDASDSVFSVVDDDGPVTYLSLTQDGICQLGHTGGQTKLYAGELSLMPSGHLTQDGGYPQRNKLSTTDGGATTATINLFLQRSGPGQSHYVNPSSSSQVFTFSLRDKDDTGTESSNGNFSYREFTFQFHNVGSAACTVKTSTPNGTVKAVDASGASIGACDGTGFSVAANTTIGFRITKFNAKHTSATNAFNVFFIETLWTAANS